MLSLNCYTCAFHVLFFIHLHFSSITFLQQYSRRLNQAKPQLVSIYPRFPNLKSPPTHHHQFLSFIMLHLTFSTFLLLSIASLNATSAHAVKKWLQFSIIILLESQMSETLSHRQIYSRPTRRIIFVFKTHSLQVSKPFPSYIIVSLQFI